MEVEGIVFVKLSDSLDSQLVINHSSFHIYIIITVNSSRHYSKCWKDILEQTNLWKNIFEIQVEQTEKYD